MIEDDDIESYEDAVEEAALEAASDEELDEELLEPLEPEEQPDPLDEIRAQLDEARKELQGLKAQYGEMSSSLAPKAIKLAKLRELYGDELAGALEADLSLPDQDKRFTELEQRMLGNLRQIRHEQEERLLTRMRPDWKKILSPDNKDFVKFMARLPKADHDRYYSEDANADDAIELIGRFEKALAKSKAKRDRLASNVPVSRGRGRNTSSTIDEEAAMEEGARQVLKGE